MARVRALLGGSSMTAMVRRFVVMGGLALAGVPPATAASTAASTEIVEPNVAAARIGKVRGPRLVFIWEASCGPCRRVFPEVERLATEWRARGVHVISLSIDDEPRRLEAFFEEQRDSLATTLVASTEPGDLDKAMQTVGIELGESFGTPIFAVLDGRGRLVGKKSGSKAVVLAKAWLAEAVAGDVER